MSINILTPYPCCAGLTANKIREKAGITRVARNSLGMNLANLQAIYVEIKRELRGILDLLVDRTPPRPTSRDPLAG